MSVGIMKKDEIDVSGIMEKGSPYSQFPVLKSAGINVREHGEKTLLHHKVFVIDSSILITGSFNPTRNGDERNDENMLAIHNEEVAREYLAYFYKLA